MNQRIRITAGDVSMEAELEDNGVARAIRDALPIEQNGFTWGDEIYFSIPVQAEAENARELVQLGDLGYWPPGNAFCIFFGPTPASRGDEIRPASAVEVVGHLLGEPAAFKRVQSGTVVKIERIED
jgi:hypothetical protein